MENLQTRSVQLGRSCPSRRPLVESSQCGDAWLLNGMDGNGRHRPTRVQCENSELQAPRLRLRTPGEEGGEARLPWR